MKISKAKADKTEKEPKKAVKEVEKTVKKNNVNEMQKVAGNAIKNAAKKATKKAKKKANMIANPPSKKTVADVAKKEQELVKVNVCKAKK